MLSQRKHIFSLRKQFSWEPQEFMQFLKISPGGCTYNSLGTACAETQSLCKDAYHFKITVRVTCVLSCHKYTHTRIHSIMHTWLQFPEAHYDGPMRIRMTLLTTNEIAELVVFCD